MGTNSLSRVQLCAAPWAVAHQAPLSMGFSRQEYWLSGWPRPPPGNRPNPGIESTCYVSCTGRWLLYHQSRLGSPHSLINLYKFKWTTQFSPFSLGTHFITMNTHYSGLLVQKSQLADSPNCCSTGSTMHSPACEQAWQRCSRYQGSLFWEKQDSSNCWLWRDDAPSARTNCTIAQGASSLPSPPFPSYPLSFHRCQTHSTIWRLSLPSPSPSPINLMYVSS